MKITFVLFIALIIIELSFADIRDWRQYESEKPEETSNDQRNPNEACLFGCGPKQNQLPCPEGTRMNRRGKCTKVFTA